MIHPHHDAHARTIEYGVRALAEVKRHRTSAEPAAYEVWYSHVSGRHRQLSHDLRAKLERGGLTEEDIQELHAAHLSSMRVSEAIEQAATNTRSEMQRVLTALRSALGDVSEFGGDLRALSAQLGTDDLDRDRLNGVLHTLVSAAKSMGTSNGGLQAKLEAAEANINSLLLALEVTRCEALTDGLTGLLNRRAFDEQLTARFDSAVASRTPLSLVMLDIDHFKMFNDVHGHPIGDQVIRLVGSSIKQKVGTADLPTRYGGEEFAIICLGRDSSAAISLAEDIRAQLAAYEIVEQGTKRSLGRITVSVGAATVREGDTAATLLERADRCLYAAKRAGRNRACAD